MFIGYFPQHKHSLSWYEATYHLWVVISIIKTYLQKSRILLKVKAFFLHIYFAIFSVKKIFYNFKVGNNFTSDSFTPLNAIASDISTNMFKIKWWKIKSVILLHTYGSVMKLFRLWRTSLHFAASHNWWEQRAYTSLMKCISQTLLTSAAFLTSSHN